MSVGAGTVADCWEITERGNAFSILFVGQFLGPLVETYRLNHVWNALPVSKREKRVLGEESEATVRPPPTEEEVHRASTIATASDDEEEENVDIEEPEPQGRLNPFRSVALLRYSFVWLIAIETGFCFGTMFTIETIIPDLYEDVYGFDSWQTGLSFLGAGIGNVLGSVLSGKISDYLLKKARSRRGGIPKKEDRLTLNAWPGGFILIPFGVLLFGWSVMLRLIYWVPIVGFGIVCFGMSQVYASGYGYLVDAIPGKGASVTASSNVCRMLMAAILSLIAKPIVNSIGSGYLSVILASVNIIGMMFYVIVKFRGHIMRRKAGYGDEDI
ncbi:hypothetical protein EC973_000207 [Apophysomyces ossiformis]|uniref:MFS general substrate transporter n=1 Tax=Apophysomyces ossiformis TaxID=679940 RepID=A0A8H7BV62_9FUNG|nr:hypothetical protein EC973_000207 [Apophysomyces ossiformis]